VRVCILKWDTGGHLEDCSYSSRSGLMPNSAFKLDGFIRIANLLISLNGGLFFHKTPIFHGLA